MPRLTSTLICDGEEHRIVWSGGRVVLEHHPDPVGDLALCALGATWSPCIAVFSVIRNRFDPVGTWPVWTGPLPRASGPELMLHAWQNLVAARRGGGSSGDEAEDERFRANSAEDRWVMAVLGLIDAPLRHRLALDAVVGHCRRGAAGTLQPFGTGTLRRGFSRRDGRGALAESILLSSIGAPPGATLAWLLEAGGDARAQRLDGAGR